MRRAFLSGDASPAEAPPATIADGIAVRVPVPEAVPIMQRVVHDVVEVGEESLREAVHLLYRTLGLVVEPAGAAGIAALLEHPDRFRSREVLTPLCGGNADPRAARRNQRMTTSLREQVPRPGRSRVTGNAGAVTAMTAGAARAGAEILARGGNAADAAVAAMLAAGVVEPAMNGLGGTAYGVVFEPGSNRITALDGSARCPARAHEGMFEPLEGVGGGLYGFPPTRGDRAETGPLSVLVPTAPATLVELHQRFGRLPFAAVVEPAVGLAEEGSSPTGSSWCMRPPATGGSGFRRRRLRFTPGGMESPSYPRVRKIVSETPSSPGRCGSSPRRVPSPSTGDPLRAGCSRRSTTRGASSRNPTSKPPPCARYRRSVSGFGTPPWRRCRRTPGVPRWRRRSPTWMRFPRQGPPSGSPEEEVRFLHLAAESLRLAFLDRFAYLGDPESVPVPLSGMLDSEYLTERRRGVEPDALASPLRKNSCRPELRKWGTRRGTARRSRTARRMSTRWTRRGWRSRSPLRWVAASGPRSRFPDSGIPSATA